MEQHRAAQIDGRFCACRDFGFKLLTLLLSLLASDCLSFCRAVPLSASVSFYLLPVYAGLSPTINGYNGSVVVFFFFDFFYVCPARCDCMEPRKRSALFIKWFNICRVSNFIKSTKTIERASVRGKTCMHCWLAFANHFCIQPKAFAEPNAVCSSIRAHIVYQIACAYEQLAGSNPGGICALRISASLLRPRAHLPPFSRRPACHE